MTIPVGKGSLVDLHSHSIASDGTDAPADLVRLALEAEVGLLALTDHDTLDGLDEFRTAARTSGIAAVAGTEVSSSLDGMRLHVVALGIRKELETPLADLLARMRQWRDDRNVLIVRRLVEMGYPITMDEVTKQAQGQVVARPHFARVMVAHGYVNTLVEAFDRFLSDKAPAYVPKKKARLEDIIKAIHASGALAVAAHPNTLAVDDADRMERRLEMAASMGLDGVEAYHPDVPPGLRQRVLSCAERLGLLVSAGSDFHGRNKVDAALGVGARGRRLKAMDAWALIERLHDHGCMV